MTAFSKGQGGKYWEKSEVLLQTPGKEEQKAIWTHLHAVFGSVIALSSFWRCQRNACEILMQSRLLVLEVACICDPKRVWLVSGTAVPSFRREVVNPRKRFVVIFFHQPARLFLQASSEFSSFLGVDLAQRGCNQDVGSSYGRVMSEQPGGFSDVNGKYTICPLWALAFVLLLSGITRLKDVWAVS